MNNQKVQDYLENGLELSQENLELLTKKVAEHTSKMMKQACNTTYQITMEAKLEAAIQDTLKTCFEEHETRSKEFLRLAKKVFAQSIINAQKKKVPMSQSSFFHSESIEKFDCDLLPEVQLLTETESELTIVSCDESSLIGF